MEKSVQKLYSIILKKLSQYEFNSFLIGLDRSYGKDGKELKMEIGSALEKKLKKEVDFKDPDITIIVNLKTGETRFKIKDIYLYGKYRKLQRNIAQTKWLLKNKMTSVEELVGFPSMKEFQAEKAVLHGCGREDFDVLMLGQGRPFVLELKDPKKRFVDLNKFVRKLKRKTNGKVEIKKLEYTTEEMVRTLKKANVKKTYIATISSKKSFDKEEVEKALKKLKESVIKQRTPLRVSRRRADLVRLKEIHKIHLYSFKPNLFEIEIETEGGTYIKELISGDKGRTFPSLNSLLGGDKDNPSITIKELDVIKVDFPN